MREYETIFVLEPNQDEASVDAEIEKVRDLIVSGGGEIAVTEKWGRRKLAYEINKRKEGIYTLIRFTAGPTVLQAVNRRYQLNENLLRHLTVLYEAPPPAPLGTDGLPQDVDAASAETRSSLIG